MWFEESAKTALEKNQFKGAPGCGCDVCTLIREELPASKIERLLRGVVLALVQMDRPDHDCVSAHLRDMQADVRGHLNRNLHLRAVLGHLARFTEELTR